jgi:hypothetical protein
MLTRRVFILSSFGAVLADGLIGATMIGPPEQELTLVGQSIGKATRRQIFGFGN